MEWWESFICTLFIPNINETVCIYLSWTYICLNHSFQVKTTEELLLEYTQWKLFDNVRPDGEFTHSLIPSELAKYAAPLLSSFLLLYVYSVCGPFMTGYCSEFLTLSFMLNCQLKHVKINIIGKIVHQQTSLSKVHYPNTQENIQSHKTSYKCSVPLILSSDEARYSKNLNRLFQQNYGLFHQEQNVLNSSCGAHI